MRISAYKRNDTPRVRSGSAMFLVVLMMVVLAGLAAALTTTTLNRYSAERSLQESESAYRAAMTGLDLALYELRMDQDLGGDLVGNVSGSIGDVTYQVTITPTFAGPGQYILSGFGQLGLARYGVELVVESGSTPGFGLFCNDIIDMSGSFSVDSYDSSLGTYSSQFSVDHAGDNGSIGSNADIKAGGGIVYGDASPGPGMQVLPDATNVMGSVAPATTPQVFAPYAYSPAIGSAGEHSGAGTLTSGVYRYDKFTLSGGDVFVIDGDVELWVDLDFTASGSSTVELTPGSSLVLHHGAGNLVVSGGGFVNPSQAPEDLQLFSSSTKKVELSGGSSYFGSVYAPDAEFVSSGGSELFGSIVAGSAKLSGDGWMHYDEALAGGGAAVGNFPVVSARRVNSW